MSHCWKSHVTAHLFCFTLLHVSSILFLRRRNYDQTHSFQVPLESVFQARSYCVNRISSLLLRTESLKCKPMITIYLNKTDSFRYKSMAIMRTSCKMLQLITFPNSLDQNQNHIKCWSGSGSKPFDAPVVQINKCI